MKTAFLQTGVFALVSCRMRSAAISWSAVAACRRSHRSQRQNLDRGQGRPTAEAVAVLGDRIVAVGSNEDVAAWRGPRTRTIDAAGKLLLPGFNDSHVHFVDGGLALDSVQLNDATSAAGICPPHCGASKEHAQGRMGNRWRLG